MFTVSIAFRAQKLARTRYLQRVVFCFVSLLTLFLNLGTFFRRLMLIPAGIGWVTVPVSESRGVWPEDFDVNQSYVETYRYRSVHTLSLHSS